MTALTLADFLRARLDEDEAVAREAFDAANRESVSFRPLDGTQTAGALSVMEMMVRWHPARVLAEVEAKRRIVEAYPAEYSEIRAMWHEEPIKTAVEYPLVLRLLALPYDSHPDYRQEWKP